MPTTHFFKKKRENKAEVEENNDKHSMLTYDDENRDEGKDEIKGNKSKLKRMKSKSHDGNKKQSKDRKKKRHDSEVREQTEDCGVNDERELSKSKEAESKLKKCDKRACKDHDELSK